MSDDKHPNRPPAWARLWRLVRGVTVMVAGLAVLGWSVTACIANPPATESRPTVQTDTSAAKPVPQAPRAQVTYAPRPESYPHAAVAKERHGSGADGYIVYFPDRPRPARAPVILFLHGWMALDPYQYGGWIDHLARRGNIVIFPIYQKGKFDAGEDMLDRALKATRAAIERLRTAGPVKPDLDRFGIVGHSFGGGLALRIAAAARAAGLPEPKAVMAAQPGWTGKKGVPLEPLRDIPKSVLLLIVEGGSDQFPERRQGKTLYQALRHIPLSNRRFVVLQSDDHGNPPLIADHASPLAPDFSYQETPITDRQKKVRAWLGRLLDMREGEIDPLDYNGYWKLFDALCEVAFSGKGTIDEALERAGGASMGRWSDGTPIKPRLILKDPTPYDYYTGRIQAAPAN